MSLGTSRDMDGKTFDRVRRFVYERSGIALGERKHVLVSARVAKRMRELGFEDYSAYFDHVLADETGGEAVCLVDVITTNVTSFYREADHFDLLAERFERWQEGGETSFRAWSAACSTGEEPYSMAMTLLDSRRRANVDIKILATDISTEVLRRAKEGRYEDRKLKPVPTSQLARYFRTPHGAFGARGDRLREVRPELKAPITFARLNLAAPPFPMSGPFDVVFCRNVMIYFDTDVRARLLGEIERLIRPGGLVFLGHSESITGMRTSLKPVGPSVYTKS